MSSRNFVGMAISVMVGVAATVAIMWPGSTATKWPNPPVLDAPKVCEGETCSIDVVVDPDKPSGCWVKLSSEVTLLGTVKKLEWRLRTPGYKFVDGENAVAILNNAGDFGPGSASTPAPPNQPTFTRDRTASPPAPGREYKVSINVVSDNGRFCPFPTLPRIKNQ